MLKRFNPVFKISVAIMILLAISGAFFPDWLEQVTSTVKTFIANKLGWYYLIVVTFFVLVALTFLITPLGKIKLGKPGEKPEFSTPTWVAMLFSAGMGIGLVFWATAEPISHYAISSPTGETGTDQAIKDAMRFTYFHWGIHAWGIYGIVAMVLAYFNFRHDKPGLVSATLEPVIGKWANGNTGRMIDILSVVATVMGVATTLGFGAVQINGGLTYLFEIPSNFLTQLVIIAIVTVLFMISAWTGLGKGIKILSNTNLVLALILFLLVFTVGPTLFQLNLFTNSLGTYVQYLPEMSFRIAPLNSEVREWINSWTIFYWAWWIAWSPFVGIFIARVSKGRSIREFVFYVLIVPCLIGFLWFATFGGTAISLEHNGIDVISQLAPEESLFAIFSNYPLGMVASILAILLISTFFITSADSGTFVLGLMTTGGKGDPSKMVKLTWGLLLSITALALLYTGGLQALQNTMIIAALPFSIIMLLMTFSFVKTIYKEGRELGIGKIPNQKKEK
ncbi:glycine/betaine ABC transporter permease [Pontibacillus halophilus JSM 076056 = DSM 19796]|uniref:Glycine/betaine ABC transporter permease n=1 Tax=Pontibacillus halophilus JSM 076056 = DSM 19796 TaxID=1385510 RepID=A0A0A5GLI6_9BACI|nr:BCCT family transporter [Pontibacillus halophilus]KGX92869.1 glycine/betaine ABC transporter permease [Pontibacillus halophilus JSM 076056 = DSM 19796]